MLLYALLLLVLYYCELRDARSYWNTPRATELEYYIRRNRNDIYDIAGAAVRGGAPPLILDANRKYRSTYRKKSQRFSKYPNIAAV
jgi:hypothetical protein